MATSKPLSTQAKPFDMLTLISLADPDGNLLLDVYVSHGLLAGPKTLTDEQICTDSVDCCWLQQSPFGTSFERPGNG